MNMEVLSRLIIIVVGVHSIISVRIVQYIVGYEHRTCIYEGSRLSPIRLKTETSMLMFSKLKKNLVQIELIQPFLSSSDR